VVEEESQRLVSRAPNLQIPPFLVRNVLRQRVAVSVLFSLAKAEGRLLSLVVWYPDGAAKRDAEVGPRPITTPRLRSRYKIPLHSRTI
jgi:hypothetical protein